MERIIFARGFCEDSVDDVIAKRLYCPTFVEPQLPLINPKLHFWSNDDSIQTAERYATHVARSQSRLPFVMTLTTTRQNFFLLAGKVAQPEGVKYITEENFIIRSERLLHSFDDVRTDKVSIAIDQLSDEELVQLFCYVGQQLDEQRGFQYVYYQTFSGIKR